MIRLSFVQEQHQTTQEKKKMKVERLINHFANGDFSAVGELVGNELPRKRLWLLNEARAELAKLQMKDALTNVPPYSEGYRDAVNDILAAFEAAVRKEIMDMIDDPNNPTQDDEDTAQ